MNTKYTPIHLSEVIAQLEVLIAEHGDIEVLGATSEEVGLEIHANICDCGCGTAILDLVWQGADAPSLSGLCNMTNPPVLHSRTGGFVQNDENPGRFAKGRGEPRLTVKKI